MNRLIASVLALAPLVATAEGLPILLVNGSGRDITLETPTSAAVLEIRPNGAMSASFQHLAWLRFGQEAYKYNIKALEKRTARMPKPLVLQAHTDGKLYLLARGTTTFQTTLPRQPLGFPIIPTRKVDLT